MTDTGPRVEDTDTREPVIWLMPDRSIEFLTGNGRRASLRPPTIGEWRQLHDLYAGADKALVEVREQAITDAGGQVNDMTLRRVIIAQEELIYGAACPYGDAFAEVVKALGEASIDVDHLPMWAADPGVYGILHQQWRHPSIERVDRPPAHGFGGASLEMLSTIPAPTDDPLAAVDVPVPPPPGASPAAVDDGAIRSARG